MDRLSTTPRALNGNDPIREELDAEYARLLKEGQAGGAGAKFLKLTERYHEVWPSNLIRLRMFETPFDGAVFLDFGCKFGHVTPLLKRLGVAQVISVDVDDEYLRDGGRFIGQRYGTTYRKSKECFIDVDSNSVDCVYANEVISHINPRDLETFYEEAARVLRPGGELIICDENNLADEAKRRELIAMAGQWDRGRSKELGSNYEAQRRKILREALPELDEERAGYFARNTAGLHGEALVGTVRDALETGRFIARPHRPGSVAINPNYGTAMERGFYPVQVVLSLAAHGMAAEEVFGADRGPAVPSEADDGCGHPFVIRALKLPETVEALQAYQPLCEER